MSPHKTTKKSVNYRGSRNQHKRCKNCENMLSNYQCKLVLGIISPQDVCNEWKSEV